MLTDILDLLVTLRCNAGCRNCIKLCNMQDALPGLDYSDSDMTVEQICALAENIADVAQSQPDKKAVGVLCITGGEALLHPDIVKITGILEHDVLRKGHIHRLEINSNALLEPPAAIAKYAVNVLPVRDKPLRHTAALLHPDDMGCARPRFSTCTHFRKSRIVASKWGMSVCCAGDGYIRLFGLDELLIHKLPHTMAGFPLDKMDAVCQHCPFGCEKEVFERDVGRPVSEIYRRAGEKHGRDDAA